MTYHVVNVPYQAIGAAEPAPCMNDDDCAAGFCCNGACVGSTADPSCAAPDAGCPPYSTWSREFGFCQCGNDLATGKKLQAYPDGSKWTFGCYLNPPGTPSPTTPVPGPAPAVVPKPSPVPASVPSTTTTKASLGRYALPGLLIAGGLGLTALLAARRRAPARASARATAHRR